MEEKEQTIIYPRFSKHGIDSYLEMVNELKELFRKGNSLTIRLDNFDKTEVGIYIIQILEPVFSFHSDSRPKITVMCAKDEETKLTAAKQKLKQLFIQFTSENRKIHLG